MEKETHTKTWNRRIDSGFVLLFFLALWLPLAAQVTGLDRSAPLEENRTLAQWPTVTIDRDFLVTGPEQFRLYYKDHFGFRNHLVRQYHALRLVWMRETPTDIAITGKDGWLFRSYGILDESRGLSPLSDDEIRLWLAALEDIQRWQTSRGGQFLFVILPDKIRMYPEQLPDWWREALGKRRMDQVLDALEEHGGIAYHDATEPLRHAKSLEPEPLWLKLDTHYNGVGAYHAYRSILGSLNVTEPLDQDQLRAADALPDSLWYAESNLARMINARSVLHEEWTGLLPKTPCAHMAPVLPATQQIGPINEPYATECGDAEFGRLFVIGDSFRWGLIPFLSEHFERAVYADYRHCLFDPYVVAQENPDIVLFVISERQFVRSPAPPALRRW